MILLARTLSKAAVGKDIWLRELTVHSRTKRIKIGMEKQSRMKALTKSKRRKQGANGEMEKSDLMTGTTDAAHRQPCAQTFLVVKPLLPVDYSRCGAKDIRRPCCSHTTWMSYSIYRSRNCILRQNRERWYVFKACQSGHTYLDTGVQLVTLVARWSTLQIWRTGSWLTIITVGNRLAALKIKGCLAKGVSALRQTIMTSHTLYCCNGFNCQYGISCCLGYSTFLGPRKKTTRIETSILLFD